MAHFLEIIVNNFVWFFDPSYSLIVLQVIWAIGLGMLFLSGIIYLSNRIISIIGLGIICLHNLFDVFVFEGQSLDAIVWYFLHQQALIEISDQTSLIFGYPIIPWIGLMAIGYILGPLYTNYQAKKKNLINEIRVYLLVFFNSKNHKFMESLTLSLFMCVTYSIMSFLNTTKYPPSLLYILMTIGPSLLLLSAIEKYKNKVTDFFVVFGRVPLFYYFSHILIIHLLAIILLVISNKDYSIMLNMTPFLQNQDQFTEYGYPLWVVYVIWLTVLLILYPLCYKYMKYKSNSKKWWLSYL